MSSHALHSHSSFSSPSIGQGDQVKLVSGLGSLWPLLLKSLIDVAWIQESGDGNRRLRFYRSDHHTVEELCPALKSVVEFKAPSNWEALIQVPGLHHEDLMVDAQTYSLLSYFIPKQTFFENLESLHFEATKESSAQHLMSKLVGQNLHQLYYHFEEDARDCAVQDLKELWGRANHSLQVLVIEQIDDIAIPSDHRLFSSELSTSVCRYLNLTGLALIHTPLHPSAWTLLTQLACLDTLEVYFYDSLLEHLPFSVPGESFPRLSTLHCWLRSGIDDDSSGLRLGMLSKLTQLVQASPMPQLCTFNVGFDCSRPNDLNDLQELFESIFKSSGGIRQLTVSTNTVEFDETPVIPLRALKFLSPALQGIKLDFRAIPVDITHELFMSIWNVYGGQKVLSLCRPVEEVPNSDWAHHIVDLVQFCPPGCTSHW